MLETIKTSLNKMKNMFLSSNNKNITVVDDLPFNDFWTEIEDDWQMFLDTEEDYIDEIEFHETISRYYEQG